MTWWEWRTCSSLCIGPTLPRDHSSSRAPLFLWVGEFLHVVVAVNSPRMPMIEWPHGVLVLCGVVMCGGGWATRIISRRGGGYRSAVAAAVGKEGTDEMNGAIVRGQHPS